MKQLYLLSFFLLSTFVFAQIPTGYYDSATSTGATLKTQLFNIINNNTNSSTVANYGDLWTLYDQAAFKDSYYDNDNSLVDLYTEIPLSPDTFNFTTITNQCGNYNSEGDCYNREHVIPKSYFGGDSSYPMYSDAHFVFPSDGYVNGKHANYPYGTVNFASYTSSNGSKLGSSSVSGYSGSVFEPIDEFKGDVARAYFYFITRYEDQLSTFYTNYASSEVSAMFDGNTFPGIESNFLNILLTWNNLDPVSQYEINKNNEIYNFQGNRNPFIDDSSYITKIWGTALSTNDFTTLNLKIYPNPVKDHFIYISTTQDLDAIIYNVLGKEILKQHLNTNNKKMDVSTLNKGVYLLKISSDSGTITKKLIKQ
ncbi:endonuclease [Aestuariibaculum lutulentum]|uniref:Endonuclease n=1 Tax=Aestuariibaculum lutulentum TaxID=2920935 RepID=A0ABS9RHM2_9FLAO|nr:endonuclease [Aestuariibaculum lutulentum]MCH4552444.1 endonuclease [Aestuariibaculum lutulentum]